MPTNKELEKNLIEMAKAIKDLAQDVAELKAVKPVMSVQTTTANPSSTSTAIATGSHSYANQFPVPPEYRELVNITLNKLFGIEIEYTPAGFLFTIIVPEKYGDQKKRIKVDKRTKIIPNYEGANGVRQWVELVYSSFSLETKSLITADR